jgi:hypothetical protein
MGEYVIHMVVVPWVRDDDTVEQVSPSDEVNEGCPFNVLAGHEGLFSLSREVELGIGHVSVLGSLTEEAVLVSAGIDDMACNEYAVQSHGKGSFIAR